jgi:5-deoxy-glucuronate isomerase
MPQLKYSYCPAPGLQEVVSPRNSMLEYISLRVLQLNPGECYAGNSGDEELALVIISGTCRIRTQNYDWQNVGRRNNPFENPAHTVYLPCNTKYEITATHGQVEIAIGGALSDRAGDPVLITPEQVGYERRGAWHWERHIYNIITTVNPVSQRLFIIEVITPPGHWSSVPPHKHDTDNPPYESRAEEIYFYKMKPEQGFGFQRVYTDDRTLDEVCLAEHNDAIVQPCGYHPVANHPGYQMYYLNIIAGEKRGLFPYDDPAHAWVKNIE